MTRFVDYGINVYHDFNEYLNDYLPDGDKIADAADVLQQYVDGYGDTRPETVMKDVVDMLGNIDTEWKG